MSTNEQTYQAIADHITENGYPPTVRELGKRLGVSSTSTVARRLKVLEAAGWIERRGGTRQLIVLKERT